MSESETAYEDGQFAYDIASQSLVKVVDSDTGTITDQEPAMRDLITRSDGNKVCGFDPDTVTVDVVYVGVDEGDKEYRMPATRIQTDEALTEAAARLTQRAGIAEEVDSDLRVDATLDEFQE